MFDRIYEAEAVHHEKGFNRIEWIRTEVDNVLWNKVLTLKLGKKAYDEIVEEIDTVFVTAMKEEDKE